MSTPRERRMALIEDFKKEITTLENISKAIHSKGIVAGENGTIDIKMSPNQLKELAEVKGQIFRMKRQCLEYELELEKEEEE